MSYLEKTFSNDKLKFYVKKEGWGWKKRKGEGKRWNVKESGR